MQYYLAPLEGITTYVYRNAYHMCFGGVDKYFTPFIVPHKNKKFDARERKELSLEHNNGLFVVPQLLTNNSGDFIKTANDIKAMGYEEINLNLATRVANIRKRKKITQMELSNSTGVSYASIRRFELTGNISLISLTKLALELGCIEEIRNLFSNVPYQNIEEVLNEYK